MPFIGQQPQTGAYHKLDSITTSATATYNLQLNGGAYYPTSANHLLVSLNGVMQAPQDSFTVSGSQITFASALTSSDNIDFIMALGDTLDIGVPSAGSVNTSQLANSAVTDAKMASTLDLSGKTVTYGLSGTDLPTGSVIQTVMTQNQSTQTQSASTTYITFTGAPSASITPLYSNSKILIIARVGMQFDAASQIENTIYRDATTDLASGNTYGMSFHGVADTAGLWKESMITWYDEPGDTSSHTYTWYSRAESAVNMYADHGGATNSMILMEIKQ